MASKNGKDLALKYLEHRDRTLWEVRKYLEGKEISEEEIRDTLNFLLDFKYLDDSLYASKYISYAMGKGRGKLRIRRELIHKGLSSDNIELGYSLMLSEACLDKDVNSDMLKAMESQRALEQARKILRGCEKIDSSLAAKVSRRLLALGYEKDLIYRTMGILFREEGEPWEQ